MTLIWRLLPYAAGVVATLVLGVFCAGFAAFYFLKPELPSVAEMRDIPLEIPLRIYSRDGLLIGQVGERKRTPVEYDEIPEIVVQAFLAAEDDRFFEHPGYDYQGIVRAALKLALTGSRAQGGSTITQQLARGYFLTRDRTFVRKAKELILAVQIEKNFSKEEILQLYLNKIFLGQRAYGVAAAAEVYFGKTLDELNVAEAATIAGLPKAPSALNPVSNPEAARGRRAYVLRRMEELNFIDAAEYTAASNLPMMSKLHGPQVDLYAPYVEDMARREALERFGEAAYTDGYKVVTTIDGRLQAQAIESLRVALLNYDRRHGYRGPLTQVNIEETVKGYVAARIAAEREAEAEESGVEAEALEPADIPEPNALDREFALQNLLNDYENYPGLLEIGIVTGVNTATDSAVVFLRDTGEVTLDWEAIRWGRFINDNIIGKEPEAIGDLLAAGDVVYLVNSRDGYRLGQLPAVQGAFVAINPDDGATIALTGGFDHSLSKFNRATQARRQPGSAFKPFIYSAALENGFTPASIINDAPIVRSSSGQEETWRPENYSRKFYGPVRLREALVRSMNLASIRLLDELSMRPALEHVAAFGFDTRRMPRDLSLALGSGETSPYQLAEAYAGFATGGFGIDAWFIDRIIDAQGDVVYATDPVTVCAECPEEWFDGRQPENEEELPDFVREAAEAAEETEPDPNSLISPEVPDYESVEQMIAQMQTDISDISSAMTWRPNYEETPLFHAGRKPAKRIITEQNAFLMYDIMRDVIKRGTGRKAADLNRPDIAGKTGTSNSRRDAWFAGFNGDIVGIAWVGFDDDARSLGSGEAGGSTALPMWKSFMATALPGTERADLPVPEGLVRVRISKKTGLLAGYGDADTRFEYFRDGNEPEAGEEELEFDGGDVFVEDGGDSSIF